MAFADVLELRSRDAEELHLTTGGPHPQDADLVHDPRSWCAGDERKHAAVQGPSFLMPSRQVYFQPLASSCYNCEPDVLFQVIYGSSTLGFWSKWLVKLKRFLIISELYVSDSYLTKQEMLLDRDEPVETTSQWKSSEGFADVWAGEVPVGARPKLRVRGQVTPWDASFKEQQGVKSIISAKEERLTMTSEPWNQSENFFQSRELQNRFTAVLKPFSSLHRFSVHCICTVSFLVFIAKLFAWWQNIKQQKPLDCKESVASLFL